jgi:protein-disulfide isomerase
MARQPAPTPGPSTPRAAFAASLAFALAGLAFAVLLIRVHHDAAAGLTSFCTISEEINCDKVALSSWSVAFGVPVAAWGAIGYLLAAGLSAWGLSSRRLHPGWPAGLLLLLSATAVAGALALAFISKVLIGAWCLLCAGSWAASAGLLLSAGWACRPAALAAVRADLREAGRRPRWVAALVVAGLVGLLALVALYPRLEAGGRAAAAGGAPGPRSPVALPPPLPAATGPAVLFSDYECPFCALAHDDLRELLRKRPDIQVVHRNFPLDQACNPMLKRPMHLRACELARAAICAEEQGRFEEMDDALFASQKAPVPVEELAARLKLDVARFKACLASRSTEARLADDVAAGMKAGLKSTPTYVVDGTLHEGKLPLERFPPPVPGQPGPK